VALVQKAAAAAAGRGQRANCRGHRCRGAVVTVAVGAAAISLATHGNPGTLAAPPARAAAYPGCAAALLRPSHSSLTVATTTTTAGRAVPFGHCNLGRNHPCQTSQVDGS
jgi:hypothetical protein